MRKLTPFLFSALLLAAFFGCDGGSGPTSPGTQTPDGINLDDEYGGLTFEDELPAFGEPSLFADELLTEDVDYNDELDDDPVVAGLRNRNGSHVYTLRICWGRLIRPGGEDSTECGDRETIYDWDGSLSIDRGAIILRKTILFDPEDYIHERSDRRLLEWTSKTSPDYDGVLVQIIDPPSAPPDSVANGNGGPDPEPNHVTFKTPLCSRTFTMDELLRISEVIPINRCGIAVSFNGFLDPSRPCPQGFLGGIWKPLPPDSLPPSPPDSTFFASADTVDGGRDVRGHFYGNWIQANGMLAGHLRGVYGVNSDGLHVFFGKYIDFSGRFKGILKGTYGSMSNAPVADTAGWFEGVWVNEYHTVTGNLNGNWAAGPSQLRGTFHGRWAKDCPHWPPDDTDVPS